MKFHERLKELRTERARTQKKLAQMMQVTDDCIWFWGKGRSEPSILQILDLCRLVRSRHRCFTWQKGSLKSTERSGNYFAIPPFFSANKPRRTDRACGFRRFRPLESALPFIKGFGAITRMKRSPYAYKNKKGIR